MYRLKIITPANHSFTLLTPADITFQHLHAALELFLCPTPYSYYSFMLMTDRSAIETPDAGDHRIAAAFARNPVIRYRIPYPNGQSFVLELMDADAPGSSAYPSVQGTKEDGRWNRLLQRYCTFTQDWTCRNPEYFTELKRSREKEELTDRSVSAHSGRAERYERLKKLEEKLAALDLWARTEEDLRIMTGISQYSQAKLLELSLTRDRLQMYCRYAGFPAGSNWKKEKLAQSFAGNLQEQIWMVMVLFPARTLELCLKWCRLKKGQRFQLDPEEDLETVWLLLNLGVADLAVESVSKTLVLELAEDFKERFLQGFQGAVRYDRSSEAAVYLSPELKAGSWQKIVKGYSTLDGRVFRLLRYYGVIKEKQLCKKLQECYDYRFTTEEFERYLLLRLCLPEHVNSGVHVSTKERYVSSRGIDIEDALETAERYQIKTELKPVDRAALEGQKTQFADVTGQIMGILSCFVEEQEDLCILMSEMTVSVAGNESWIEFLYTLWELLEEGESLQLLLWYGLSRMYLKLPVSGLGGYSRVEYAAAHQIGNPYKVLNDEEETPDELGEGIFQRSLDEQWELFCDCDRMMEGDELAERRLQKNAGRILGTDSADVLLMYCYIWVSDPKLMRHLEKMEKRGNRAALAMLESLQQILDFEPYEE